MVLDASTGAGASTVVQLALGVPYQRVLVQVLAALFPVKLPISELGNTAQDGLGAEVPATWVGHQAGGPGSLLWPVHDLPPAMAVIWGINHQMEDLFLCFLCFL